MWVEVILANCSHLTRDAINKWESGKTIPANNWRRENQRVMTSQVLQKSSFKYQRIGLKLLETVLKPWNIFAKKKKKMTLFMHVLWKPNIKWRIVPYLCTSLAGNNSAEKKKNQHHTNHWIPNEVFFASNATQNKSNPVSQLTLSLELNMNLEFTGGILLLLFCLKRKFSSPNLFADELAKHHRENQWFAEVTQQHRTQT